VVRLKAERGTGSQRLPEQVGGELGRHRLRGEQVQGLLDVGDALGVARGVLWHLDEVAQRRLSMPLRRKAQPRGSAAHPGLEEHLQDQKEVGWSVGSPNLTAIAASLLDADVWLASWD
jgi:hypothetical protein